MYGTVHKIPKLNKGSFINDFMQKSRFLDPLRTSVIWSVTQCQTPSLPKNWMSFMNRIDLKNPNILFFSVKTPKNWIIFKGGTNYHWLCNWRCLNCRIWRDFLKISCLYLVIFLKIFQGSWEFWLNYNAAAMQIPDVILIIPLWTVYHNLTYTALIKRQTEKLYDQQKNEASLKIHIFFVFVALFWVMIFALS